MIKKVACKIFQKNTKYKPKDIKQTILLHQGFTNISYFFRTNDDCKFQIRIGNDNKIIDRKNEKLVLDTIKNKDFIYFNERNGDAVKKWINGSNPNLKLSKSFLFLKKLSKEIKLLHEIPINNDILIQDYSCFIKKANMEESKLNLYLMLMQKYKNEKLVISHNDLNPANIIYTLDNKIHFIDFEWSRLNHEYWDIANYFREVNISLRKMWLYCKLNNLNFKKLTDYVYICTCFAYQWTFYMEETEKILSYRKHTLEQMNHYYKIFYKSILKKIL